MENTAPARRKPGPKPRAKVDQVAPFNPNQYAIPFDPATAMSSLSLTSLNTPPTPLRDTYNAPAKEYDQVWLSIYCSILGTFNIISEAIVKAAALMADRGLEEFKSREKSNAYNS